MEKIYMEDSSRQSSSQIKLSVVLSFVVAISAMFALVACGLSQVSKVSYAAPTDGEIVPDEFNFVVDPTQTLISDGNNSFGIPSYYAGSLNGKSILCIEPSANVVNSTPYERGTQAITDPGLLYLLSEFYDDNGNNKDVIDVVTNRAESNPKYINDSTSQDETALMNKYFNNLVKQASIWAYITESTKGTYTSTLNNAENGSVLLNWYHGTEHSINSLIVRNLTSNFQQSATLVDAAAVLEKIQYYVNTAKTKTNFSQITITPQSTEVSKNEDGNYQLSYNVAIDGGDLNGYTVSVTNADANPYPADKVWIVDESGNPIQNGEVTCTASSCLDKFTVIVSKDVIAETKTNYVFNVVVSAEFDSLTGGIYQAKSNPDSLQKVVTVSTSTDTDYNSDQFVISEDTGMTTTQTIYFIGLVVLLCGIGIVYANAKPAESKQ